MTMRSTMPQASRAALHVREKLLVYTLLSAAAGLAVGALAQGFFKANQDCVRLAILALAIATIYPSMIQLRSERLASAARRRREIAVGLSVVFLASPLLAIAFSYAVSNPEVASGFVAANVVPASSASIGYVLIADGDIELATVLAVVSIIGALASIPGYLGLYASMSATTIPLSKIMLSVLYTLVAPLAAGQATRYAILGRHPSKERQESIKYLLQLATMASMLALIFLLVAFKAGLVVRSPLLAGEVIALQAVMIAALLGITVWADRALGVAREAHAAIAFISATKNQSIAAAIAVMALGPQAALVPALVPIIQAPLVIAYLQTLVRTGGQARRKKELVALPAS